MRCVDGLCGDDACWYCSRKRTPDEDADDMYDGDPMHGDEYEGIIHTAQADERASRTVGPLVGGSGLEVDHV